MKWRLIHQWLRQRLTLRLRLALGVSALLLAVNVGLALFINAALAVAVPSSTQVMVFPIPLPADEIGRTTPSPPVRPVEVTPQAPLAALSSQAPLAPERILQQARGISMIGLGLAAVLGGITAYWLSGHALRPVGDLVRAVQQINADTLGHHLAFEGPQDELKALADAFNTMLNRLQRAFEQQSRFVADAAHELRTPLATMRANLEVILADAQAGLEDYREASTAQERSLTRLERLVDDLLLLAQGERGIAKGEVALGPLVEEVLLNLTPLAAERQVALRFSGSQELILYGNEPLLARALSNLVENGIHYNRPAGEVNVILSQEGAWAVIKVADTGIGIPPEEQRHIFERFYRADRSRSRHKGAGLGLSIVAHIVHLHAGTIQVESTPGVGSTFTMRLPL